VALGDEVLVYEGLRLADHVSVYPRLKIPSGVHAPAGVDITDAEDVLKYL
jgi:hypothetical protein